MKLEHQYLRVEVMICALKKMNDWIFLYISRSHSQLSMGASYGVVSYISDSCDYRGEHIIYITLVHTRYGSRVKAHTFDHTNQVSDTQPLIKKIT